jgi:hypothetical protein
MSAAKNAAREEGSYVARITECGCVVAALVDCPDWDDNDQRILEFTSDHTVRGRIVEQLPLEVAQALPWGWPCAHMQAATAAKRAAEADAKLARAACAPGSAGGSGGSGR